jgi:hypothetical protein
LGGDCKACSPPFLVAYIQDISNEISNQNLMISENHYM